MNTQYLQTPEGKIAYEETGSGPLVVCVPGMGDVRSQYRFLAPQLVADGYRVVTMDNRGHGESSLGWQDYSVAGVGSDILALIRHLNAGPAIVIAHSMAAGGAVWAAVEQERAAESGSLIRALVLVGPSVHGTLKGAMRLLVNVMFTRPWGPAMWLWYYRQLYPTRKPADFIEYTAALRRSLERPGRIEALLRMMSSSQQASAERLEQVGVPALVVMGSKDPDFKPDAESEARWVAERIHADYRMIAGAGHYPHAEMPDVTFPKISAFLKTLQPEVSHAQAGR